MWYLILCFTLFLFLSESKTLYKMLSSCFLLYLIRLEFTDTFTLNEYLLWSISLLHLFWFYTYLDYKRVYLIDTVVVSCVKILELLLIVFPFVSFHLPEILSLHLFKLDSIYLSGVMTCLVLRETGYNIKVSPDKLKPYLLLVSTVLLHVIVFLL